MKIAAISDVHGNLAALDAVLADITSRGVDEIVNLGDLFSGALAPRQTADRLIPLALPTVRGNHERQLLTIPLEQMSPADRHAISALRPDQLEWIASLPETLRLREDVLLVHGTPGTDLGYFLQTVTAHGVREAFQAEVQERAGRTQASVILCGHTHLARVVQLESGTLIVNPGSVGLPAYEEDQPYLHRMESGSPHARYAILSWDNNLWSIELIAVAYDWETAAREAESNGRADWAKALRTGRA